MTRNPPTSQPPWQQLAQQLRQPEQPEHLSHFCDHCQAELPLFVSDELAGQPVDELYPDIAHHLDLCPQCLQEYATLARLLTAAFYAEEPE